MKKVNIKSELFEYIAARIKELDSEIEELVQECENEERADQVAYGIEELKKIEQHFLDKAVNLIIE